MHTPSRRACALGRSHGRASDRESRGLSDCELNRSTSHEDSHDPRVTIAPGASLTLACDHLIQESQGLGSPSKGLSSRRSPARCYQTQSASSRLEATTKASSHRSRRRICARGISAPDKCWTTPRGWWGRSARRWPACGSRPRPRGRCPPSYYGTVPCCFWWPAQVSLKT